ncbi:MAG: outer membrane protein assembly factor BamE [Gallionellaceae bacterium]
MRLSLVLITLLMASCSLLTPHKVEVRQGNLISPEMQAKVKIGMTQQQVRAALGTPLVNDIFHANRWDYIYRFQSEGQLIEEKKMTLYFVNDVLQRIENAVSEKK